MLLLLIIPLLAWGPSLAWGQDWAEVAKYLEGEKGRRKIPGYSAGVYWRGETAWLKAAGTADRKTGRAVGVRTPFRIASISKPLTAAGVLRLAERRQLNLSEEIYEYCPAFPAKGLPITLAQLLGHLGGIRHYRNRADANNPVAYAGVSEALRKFAADPLEHEPGTKYLYSTYGFNLLGCAIEGASGVTYEEWMRDQIFATVGMCDTGLDRKRARAEGYQLNETGEVVACDYSDNSAKFPGGGLVSTASDLLRFVDGIYREQVLRQESIEAMWTSGKLRNGKLTGYGLGWSLGRTPEGEREIYHTGSQQGTSAILYLRPEKGFAFVWLTNLEGIEDRLPVAREVYRLVVGGAGKK
ncbi:MAG: serine hydrolase domain-containing protein [Bryobacter sp.]|nr:serine hydrolase domain-containing protein [Bryobacter sp.]